MGGFASGRYSHKTRITENYSSIDVRHLHRKELLDVGTTWYWRINRLGFFTVRMRVEQKNIDLFYQQNYGSGYVERAVSVSLDHTDCNYGGKRTWFLCPCCNRRVTTLYFRYYFACRHCHLLTYSSQLKPRYLRHACRGDKIRQRLGWRKGILNLPESRPKGMHRKTYLRLLRQKNKFDSIALAGMGEQLEGMNTYLQGPMYYLFERYRDI